MQKSTYRKKYALAFITMTFISSQVRAEYVWLKPVGCATVIDFKKTTEEPQFYFGNKKITIAMLEQLNKPKPKQADGGGDIVAIVVSGIPGFGPLASVGVGLVSETIVNGTLNTVRENTIAMPSVDPKEIAYKLTVKPDFGDQFTVIYGLIAVAPGQKSNGPDVDTSTLAIGSRIQIMKTESDGIVNLSFGIRFAGIFTANFVVPRDSQFTDVNKKDYLRNCYGDDPAKYEAMLYRDGQVFSDSLPVGLVDK